MENSNLHTVEINGVKYEVNLEGATRVHQLKVGSRVKVLTKDYSSYKSHAGVIVGVDMFKALPTVIVAYVPTGSMFSTDAAVEFAYLNAESKDLEIVPMAEDDILPTREGVIANFTRAIKGKHADIAALEMKQEYFLRRFGVALGFAGKDLAQEVTQA